VFSVEINQLQRAIETKNNDLRGDLSIKKENAGNEKKTSSKNQETNSNIFTKRSLLDNLVILMGAIAILAAIFLVFAHIFLTVSKKNKGKQVLAPKNQPDIKQKTEILQIPTETTNVPNEIDRYKESPQNSESVTYSMKELFRKTQQLEIISASSKQKIESVQNEEPKKMRAMEVKNEIVKRFDKGEDTAKIAQDFSMSKDQVIMILNLAGRK
jgi:hypothetical protein